MDTPLSIWVELSDTLVTLIERVNQIVDYINTTPFPVQVEEWLDL